MVPAPFIGLMMLTGSMVLGYLWIDTLCGALGQQIRTLETRYEALDGECRRESDRWTAMKAPENIEQALLRHGLNMTLPHGEQVVRMTRPGADGAYRERVQYAGRH